MFLMIYSYFNNKKKCQYGRIIRRIEQIIRGTIIEMDALCNRNKNVRVHELLNAQSCYAPYELKARLKCTEKPITK